MDVTLPNGQIIRGVPDGTPKDVIMQKAISSGMATAEDFGQSATNNVPQNTGETLNERSIPEQIIGGASGAVTLASDIVGTGVGGLTALVDVINPFTDNDSEQLINQIKDKFKIDPNQGGEEALTELGGIIDSSGAGDLIKSVGEFSDKAGQQGLDLTDSPAFATFVKIIPDIIAEVSGANIIKKGARAKALEPVTEQARKTALAKVSDIDEGTGITRLTSDVAPPETRIGKLMQGQGELVAGFQRKNQQSQRVRAIEKLANKYDIIEGVGFESKIVDGLKNSVQETKRAIGELYDESTAKLDKLGDVPLTKTKKFASEIIEREGKKGTLSDQSIIDDMQTLIDAPEDLSFELIKEIRSSVGANLEKVKRGAPVQGNSDTGLLKRVYGRLTADMKSFADNVDPQLSGKWKKANAAVEEFATGANKTGAKAIIKNGDATPEVVDRLLFSGKNSDVEFLAKNLDETGKKAAKQRVLQRALDKSSIDGDDINPNKFLSQLNKTKNQISKMFTAEESKAILSLKEQLSKTRRAQDASVTTPTGQQLTIAAALAIPSALAPGLIQGVIESKPVRDLIIKRGAARTVRDITAIDDKIKIKINELGLGGALATGALLEKGREE